MERETEGWASPVWCPFPVLNTKTSGQALGRYVVKESSHPGIHSSAISKTHLLFPHPTHLIRQKRTDHQIQHRSGVSPCSQQQQHLHGIQDGASELVAAVVGGGPQALHHRSVSHSITSLSIAFHVHLSSPMDPLPFPWEPDPIIQQSTADCR